MKRFSLRELLVLVGAVAFLCAVIKFWWPDLQPGPAGQEFLDGVSVGWRLEGVGVGRRGVGLLKVVGSMCGTVSRVTSQAGSLLFAIVILIKATMRILGTGESIKPDEEQCYNPRKRR